MSEEKIESVIRSFIEAFEKKDVEKALTFFTEEAVWLAPEGTFKGKEELKRYMTWMNQYAPDLKMRDTGIGIMVKGNKAVYEYIVESSVEGTKYETPGICVYEFSDEKIQYHRAVYDRLSIGRQAAKGWLAKRMVRSFIERAEKGLH